MPYLLHLTFHNTFPHNSSDHVQLCVFYLQYIGHGVEPLSDRGGVTGRAGQAQDQLGLVHPSQLGLKHRSSLHSSVGTLLSDSRLQGCSTPSLAPPTCSSKKVRPGMTSGRSISPVGQGRDTEWARPRITRSSRAACRGVCCAAGL